MADFLEACARRAVPRTPVWYMRQAGRCLPGYRKLRERYDILTLCKTPELAAEVSLMPVTELGVDAAILFADIMLPLSAIGVDLDIVDSLGPVIRDPLSDARDLKKLHAFEPALSMDFLGRTIGILRGELPSRIPLIGFAGAPFTLATYLVEGGKSDGLPKTKAMMRTSPEVWKELMSTLTDTTVRYLQYQIAAGVQAVQLFDSWAGRLTAEEYRTHVLPYSREIFARLGSGVPRIHFGTQTGPFLADFADVECEVIGIDSTVPMKMAWDTVGATHAVQGNLDPRLLLGDFSGVRDEVDRIFTAVDHRPGFIFNLGDRKSVV